MLSVSCEMNPNLWPSPGLYSPQENALILLLPKEEEEEEEETQRPFQPVSRVREPVVMATVVKRVWSWDMERGIEKIISIYLYYYHYLKEQTVVEVIGCGSAHFKSILLPEFLTLVHNLFNWKSNTNFVGLCFKPTCLQQSSQCWYL